MPIDPNILAGLNTNVAPAATPAQSLAQIQQLQSQGLTIREQQAKFEQQKKAAADQKLMSQAYQMSLGPDGKFNRDALIANVSKFAPEHVPALVKELDAADLSAAKLQETKANIAKLNLEQTQAQQKIQDAELDYFGSRASWLKSHNYDPTTFALEIARLQSEGHDVTPITQAINSGRTIKEVVDATIQASDKQRQLGVSEQNASLSVKPQTIDFFSQAALSGVKVNDLIPSFGMGQAAVKAKSAFLNGIAEQAKTLGIDGHTFGAMLVDSRAKQAAYTNAQKLGTQTRINESNAKKNFAQLIGLAEKLDAKKFQTSIPILNEWVRTGVVKLTGDQDVNNFLGILTEGLTEYAKVVSGQTTGAGVTNHANAQAQSLISRGLNSGTIKSFQTQAERAMQNRIDSFDDALKGLFGNIESLQQRREGGLGEGAVPADIKSALASVPASKPGESYKAPDGTAWIKLADGTIKKAGG